MGELAASREEESHGQPLHPEPSPSGVPWLPSLTILDAPNLRGRPPPSSEDRTGWRDHHIQSPPLLSQPLLPPALPPQPTLWPLPFLTPPSELLFQPPALPLHTTQLTLPLAQENISQKNLLLYHCE